jgi:hypothetical protein
MYWDATRPSVHDANFSARIGKLRPGVPVVNAQGRLDRATVGWRSNSASTPRHGRSSSI